MGTNGGDRGTRTPDLCDASAALSRFGKVRIVGRKTRIAKEAAEGAYIIGDGLLGGKYKRIVDGMQLKGVRGTMFDHILIKGINFRKP